MQRNIPVQISGKQYNILIQDGLFSTLPELLSKRYYGKKIAIITDSLVFELYGEKFVEELKLVGLDTVPIIFSEGEVNKTLDTLTSFYTSLANAGFTRSDVVIALGGGVTGDMAGFAAATFLRGMPFVQIPTTLLAMVDSSIGGKVAVDLPQGKNLVGAFWQPQAVFTDPQILESLSDKRFSEGMAELIKHGFIKDAALYDRLMQYPGRDMIKSHMTEFIADSCEIKRRVVEADELDNGERQLLNFGHTLGHALERVVGYGELSHGDAISYGMCVFTKITTDWGLTEPGTLEAVTKGLQAFGLPTNLPSLDKTAILDAMTIDKKARSGNITIVYLKKIGEAALLTLPIAELKEKLHGYL